MIPHLTSHYAFGIMQAMKKIIISAVVLATLSASAVAFSQDRPIAVEPQTQTISEPVVQVQEVSEAPYVPTVEQELGVPKRAITPVETPQVAAPPVQTDPVDDYMISLWGNDNWYTVCSRELRQIRPEWYTSKEQLDKLMTVIQEHPPHNPCALRDLVKGTLNLEYVGDYITEINLLMI